MDGHESTAEGGSRTEWARGKNGSYSWNELQTVCRKLGRELEKWGRQVDRGGCRPAVYRNISYSVKRYDKVGEKMESNAALQQ